MPKGRILAVDDQRYFRELIEGLLVEEGFEAQTASSGEEALRILEHSDFDIVLTDLVMPGMDGSDLVHRIKERNPDQDVVVVTGVVDVKAAVEAMKLGANEYLLKPFDRSALTTSLENILQRRRLRAERDRLLAENIEYLGERTLFERASGFFSCLAINPLAERVVEGLCVETRAQGGVIWVSDEADADRLSLAAARGLVRISDEPRALAPDALPEPVRDAESPALLAGPVEDEGGGREALWVPLRCEGRRLGWARLTDKLGGEAFDETDRACAGKLGDFAATALRNALRVRALERRALEQRGGRAEIFEYFQGVVRNEIEKAQRFGRGFSLLKLEIDPPEGGDGGRRGEWLDVAAKRLGALLRATDLLAREGDDALWVLLPEADTLGAVRLKQRAREALASAKAFASLPEAERPRLHLGLACHPADGTQLEALTRTLSERTDEERRGPVRALGLSGMTLAECLRALLAQGRPERPQAGPQIARFLFSERTRRPREAGWLFAAPGESLAEAVREGLGGLRGLALRSEVSIIGEAPDPGAPSAVRFLPAPTAPDLLPFVLHLGEGPAYLMVRDDGEAGRTRPEQARLFQTGDRGLIEHLAFRIQRELAIGAAPAEADR